MPRRKQPSIESVQARYRAAAEESRQATLEREKEHQLTIKEFSKKYGMKPEAAEFWAEEERTHYSTPHPYGGSRGPWKPPDYPPPAGLDWFPSEKVRQDTIAQARKATGGNLDISSALWNIDTKGENPKSFGSLALALERIEKKSSVHVVPPRHAVTPLSKREVQEAQVAFSSPAHVTIPVANIAKSTSGTHPFPAQSAIKALAATNPHFKANPTFTLEETKDGMKAVFRSKNAQFSVWPGLLGLPEEVENKMRPGMTIRLDFSSKEPVAITEASIGQAPQSSPPVSPKGPPVAPKSKGTPRQGVEGKKQAPQVPQQGLPTPAVVTPQTWKPRGIDKPYATVAESQQAVNRTMANIQADRVYKRLNSGDMSALSDFVTKEPSLKLRGKAPTLPQYPMGRIAGQIQNRATQVMPTGGTGVPTPPVSLRPSLLPLPRQCRPRQPLQRPFLLKQSH
jgi:hypothetical protein